MGLLVGPGLAGLWASGSAGRPLFSDHNQLERVLSPAHARETVVLPLTELATNALFAAALRAILAPPGSGPASEGTGDILLDEFLSANHLLDETRKKSQNSTSSPTQAWCSASSSMSLPRA